MDCACAPKNKHTCFYAIPSKKSILNGQGNKLHATKEFKGIINTLRGRGHRIFGPSRSVVQVTDIDDAERFLHRHWASLDGTKLHNSAVTNNSNFSGPEDNITIDSHCQI